MRCVRVDSRDRLIEKQQQANDILYEQNQEMRSEISRLKIKLAEEKELSSFIADERDRECELRHKNENMLSGELERLRQKNRVKNMTEDLANCRIADGLMRRHRKDAERFSAENECLKRQLEAAVSDLNGTYLCRYCEQYKTCSSANDVYRDGCVLWKYRGLEGME